jgi:hypothetical protein
MVRRVVTTASRPTPRLRLPRTRDEVFAATTVVLTVVALLLTLTEHYDVGAVVSLAAVLLGGSSQLLSETRLRAVGERLRHRARRRPARRLPGERQRGLHDDRRPGRRGNSG